MAGGGERRWRERVRYKPRWSSGREASALQSQHENTEWWQQKSAAHSYSYTYERPQPQRWVKAQQRPNAKQGRHEKRKRKKKKNAHHSSCVVCYEGHEMCKYILDAPWTCSGCKWELPKKQEMWCCSICKVDYCLDCAAHPEAFEAEVEDEEPGDARSSVDAADDSTVDGAEEPRPVPRVAECSSGEPSTTADTDVGATTQCSASSDYNFEVQSTAQSTAESVPGNKGDAGSNAEVAGPCAEAPVVEECTLSPANWSVLQDDVEASGRGATVDLFSSLYEAGDETTIGPDGDEYEIFYPPPGPAEPQDVPQHSGAARDVEEETPANSAVELSYSTCSASRSEANDDVNSTHTTAAATSAVNTANCQIPFQGSSEISICDVVNHMRSVQLARYPARARLFEEVRLATSKALGKNFCRLALVGSTALGIDTPDSDLDVVAFTQPYVDGDAKALVGPPNPVQILHRIAEILVHKNKHRHRGEGGNVGPLRIQVVDCTRVPVLNVVEIRPDGVQLSLDLTVDQPLGEWHVLWFLSQRSEPEAQRAPLNGVPVPQHDGWEHGLEASALRCVKWWLRRRGLPLSKEGGYPSVTWTLMVIHVLRCSVFVSTEPTVGPSGVDVDDRVLLGAIAAFFDRFARGGGPVGTLLFEDGAYARFMPHRTGAAETNLPLSAAANLSVLDPTTTRAEDLAWGVQPTDLAKKISMATLLLQAYELHRAARLSVIALQSSSPEGLGPSGGEALRALFGDVAEGINVVPVELPEAGDAHGVRGCMLSFVLQGGKLHCGLLRRVEPKQGWNAPFLHRSDAKSRLAIQRCDVDFCTGALIIHGARDGEVEPSALLWFSPSEFVCMARLRSSSEAVIPGMPPQLDDEDLERWCEMNALLACAQQELEQQDGVGWGFVASR